MGSARTAPRAGFAVALAGRFDRTLALPVTIDRERVEASYRRGMLTVVLPRSEAEKPRTIQVS